MATATTATGRQSSYEQATHKALTLVLELDDWEAMGQPGGFDLAGWAKRSSAVTRELLRYGSPGDET
jgi:hypothetical protein